MQVLYSGSVPKFASHPSDNEDVFKVDAPAGKIIVCDGASESFDARRWAELLAAHFQTAPVAAADVSNCVDLYNQAVVRSKLSWSQQVSFDRGSYSTLSKVEVDAAACTITLTTIGDSLTVVTDGETFIHCQPYEHSGRFAERPTLLSTLDRHNTVFSSDASAVITHVTSYEADRPTFVLCMTDALGAWLLGRSEAGDTSALADLLAVRSDTELADLVDAARAAGVMRRDDCTLVVAMP